MSEKRQAQGSELSGQLGPGDRVRVLASELPHYYKPGDFAVLRRQDDDGDWWGDIEGGEVDVCLTEHNGKIERAQGSELSDGLDAAEILDRAAEERLRNFKEMILSGFGFCAQCGITGTDEDGTCSQCGATAQGKALTDLAKDIFRAPSAQRKASRPNRSPKFSRRTNDR